MNESEKTIRLDADDIKLEIRDGRFASFDWRAYALMGLLPDLIRAAVLWAEQLPTRDLIASFDEAWKDEAWQSQIIRAEGQDAILIECLQDAVESRLDEMDWDPMNEPDWH